MHQREPVICFYLLLSDAVGAGVPAGASGITIIVAGIVPLSPPVLLPALPSSAGSGAGIIRALGGIARIGEALLGELLSLLLLLGFLFGSLLLCVLLSLLLRVFGGLLVGVVGQAAALSLAQAPSAVGAADLAVVFSGRELLRLGALGPEP